MKVSVLCPKCNNMEEIDLYPGVFDTIFYDEPRFPGSTVYTCPKCNEVTNVGGSIGVRVNHGRGEVPVRIKTDEYTMTFKIKTLHGEVKEFDISRLEEVIRRFAFDGCIPD